LAEVEPDLDLFFKSPQVTQQSLWTVSDILKQDWLAKEKVSFSANTKSMRRSD
jgi:hypothetical protein